VAALCRAGARVEGQWPLAALERLSASLPHGAGEDSVAWSLEGALRQRPGAAPERWLHVRASSSAVLLCQRCLEPMRHTLEVDRSILFADNEDEAERLDEEIEEDVLALPVRLDASALIEDELILALPLVPRHESCVAPAVRADGPAEHRKPFEVLAQLRRGER
jgi:uncharacterized protein